MEAGLAALVEVHDEEELIRALKVSPALVGVNNRNLKTFEVDLGTTERLAAKLATNGNHRSLKPASSASAAAPSPLLVAESGIHSRGDVARLQRCGAGAILVGESLVRQGNIRQKVAELLGQAV
jgi:indole-3-glycerol phosphate synthase